MCLCFWLSWLLIAAELKHFLRLVLLRLSLVSLVCLLLVGYRTGLGLDADDGLSLAFSGLTLFKRFSLMLFLMSKLVFELASALVKSFTRLSILFFFVVVG